MTNQNKLIDDITRTYSDISSVYNPNKKVAPKGMSALGHTTVFPREDNLYMSKESIPYDEEQSKVWKDRPVFKNEALKEWMAYAVIGFLVVTIGIFMKIAEEGLLELALHMTQTRIDEGSDRNAWLSYALMAGLYGTLGGILTTYYGPAAAGSGVAELIGYLNGVNQHEFLGMNTLFTKVVGVSFAVSARLAVGKEGPLAHIGAIVGAAVLYIPGLGLEHLRNDETKRLFIAAGASTGVSVAFGSPIGGALFCYELSRPNTFWRFTMIWKVFFAASLGTFVMAMWNGIRTGNYLDWSGA